MRWLVTVRTSADLDRVRQVIHDRGGECDPENPPVPLGETELMLEAQGPQAVTDALAEDPDVIEVFPDSEMHLY